MGLWTITSQNVIAQDSDPGAVGAGVLWTDTNANLTYRRNDANDGWNVIGSDTAVTATEYAYLDGVTSAIQTQLAAKLSSVTVQEDTITSNFTTVSDTFVDVTGLAITLPTRTAGIGIAFLDAVVRNNTPTAQTFVRLVYGAVNGIEAVEECDLADSEASVTRTKTGVLDGTVVKVQAHTSTVTTTTAMVEGYSGGGTILTTLEIS